MRKVLLTCLMVATLAVAACGGGGDSNAQTQPGNTGGGAGGSSGSGSNQPETLVGVDADRNGVRDDVDALITEKFSADPVVKKGVTDVARMMQQSMVTDVTVVKDTSSLIRQGYNVSACASAAMTTAQLRAFANATDEVYAQTFNTLERLDQRKKVVEGATKVGVLKYDPSACASLK